MPTIQDILLLCFLGAVIALEGDLRKHHVLLRKVIEQSQERELQLAMQQAAIAVLPTKSSSNLATVTVTAVITKPCTFAPLTMGDAMAVLFGYLLIWFTLLVITLIAMLMLPYGWPLQFWYTIRDLVVRVVTISASAVNGMSKIITNAVNPITNTSDDISGGSGEAKKDLQPESSKLDAVPSTVSLESVPKAAAASINVDTPPVGSDSEATKRLDNDAKPPVQQLGIPAAVNKDDAVTACDSSTHNQSSTKLISDNKSVVSVSDLVDKVTEKQDMSSVNATNPVDEKVASKNDGEPASVRQLVPTIAVDRRSGIAEKDVAYDESLRVLHNAEITLNDEFIKVMASKLKHEPVNSVDEDFVLHAECFQLSFPKVSRTHSKRLKITLHLHAELLVEAMQGLKIVMERIPELAMSQSNVPFELAKEILDTSPGIARQEIADRVKEIYKDTVVGVWLPKVAEMVCEEVAARDPPFEKRVSRIDW